MLNACSGFKQTENTKQSIIDLSVLNPNLAYSEIYNITMNAKEYAGKTIKLKGTFDYYYKDIETKTKVFVCFVTDAAGCCSQGIEFVLSGEHSFPEDYPEIGAEITVIGTFASYEADSNQFCSLINAVLE